MPKIHTFQLSLAGLPDCGLAAASGLVGLTNPAAWRAEVFNAKCCDEIGERLADAILPPALFRIESRARAMAAGEAVEGLNIATIRVSRTRQVGWEGDQLL